MHEVESFCGTLVCLPIGAANLSFGDNRYAKKQIKLCYVVAVEHKLKLWQIAEFVYFISFKIKVTVNMLICVWYSDNLRI